MIFVCQVEPEREPQQTRGIQARSRSLNVSDVVDRALLAIWAESISGGYSAPLSVATRVDGPVFYVDVRFVSDRGSTGDLIAVLTTSVPRERRSETIVILKRALIRQRGTHLNREAVVRSQRRMATMHNIGGCADPLCASITDLTEGEMLSVSGVIEDVLDDWLECLEPDGVEFS